MATGLLIRDFFKDYRELRYSGQGSIRFSEIEHNAYRMALTLEVTHIAGPRYPNLKTLPENTHYGYATLFRGSTVIDSVAVKYPKFRLFDIRNDAIWQYHQHSENMKLLVDIQGQLAAVESDNLLEQIVDVLDAPSCFILRGLFPQGSDPVADFVLNWNRCSVPAGSNEVPFVEAYRAFPVASPFPDLVKFKSDIPCSFMFRLEIWYLVNPGVYIVDSPTDSGDETEDEPEYPEPDDSGNFPPSSPPDGSSDPRDYGSDGTQVPPPPFTGGQCPGVLYRVFIELGGTVAPPVATVPYDVLGPVKGIRQESDTLNGNVIRRYYLRHGEPESEVLLGALFVTLDGVANNPVCRVVSVSRLDGQPDNCGDPPPIIG